MKSINAAIRSAGVIWHACGGCGTDWPFPKGSEGERDWRCHNCVQADWATLQREQADALGDRGTSDALTATVADDTRRTT
jgi:hypothetical protein